MTTVYPLLSSTGHSFLAVRFKADYGAGKDVEISAMGSDGVKYVLWTGELSYVKKEASGESVGIAVVRANSRAITGFPRVRTVDPGDPITVTVTVGTEPTTDPIVVILDMP